MNHRTYKINLHDLGGNMIGSSTDVLKIVGSIMVNRILNFECMAQHAGSFGPYFVFDNGWYAVNFNCH